MTMQGRDSDEFARLAFPGLEMVPPGVVLVSEWRPEQGTAPRPTPAEVSCYGGTGRKPLARPRLQCAPAPLAPLAPPDAAIRLPADAAPRRTADAPATANVVDRAIDHVRAGPMAPSVSYGAGRPGRARGGVGLQARCGGAGPARTTARGRASSGRIPLLNRQLIKATKTPICTARLEEHRPGVLPRDLVQPR